jgi:predicted ATPase/DNA-binding winged helix-turn-helix (wHTH) protein
VLTAPASCRFGRFELDATSRQLLSNGSPIALGARAFDVLLALVERRGRLVTKDELMDLVWPGLVVEENNLQVQISALRKALGANAIATIPGRGYRFALDTSPSGEALSALEPARHNLPHPLTSFIGLEDDLREYGELLGQTRLLTLTGIGGCGKTRLAIKLAESILPSFPDGVWFVDLAPLSNAEGVPLHVATTLGIRKQADQPHIETLCDYIAGRRMLLVLDNCEHLSAMCAELTQRLLGAALGLRVLATSREGLNVHGERTVTVRSLALPAAGSAHDLQGLQSSEAVRLFVERAQLAVTRFAIDAGTARVVAEICRRLDGIPLAIELAAARVKVLSVDEIRMRLHDRFRLLTGSHAAALPRQQTLLAAIQWSYDHLAPDEQRLLRLLSVFARGWTLAGAVRVIDENADEYEVLDLLTRLVDLSLVTIEYAEGGGTRYAMLETVRQYARDQLNQSGEGNTARSRHLKFFVALAEEAAPQVNGREQGIWLARLKSESANLLQAAAVCDLVDDGAELGLRLVHALLDFWFHLGLIELGHQVTLAALGRAGATVRNEVRANALLVAGALSRSVERRDEANAYLVEALSIAREIHDDRPAVEALMLLGYLANDRGSSASAFEVLREALTLASALGDKMLVARVLNATGEVHRVAGNYEAAQPLYEQSLATARQQENTFTIATVCDNLARVFVSRGMPDRALNLIQEVLAISLTAGSKWTALCAFDVAAGLGAAAADWTFAARMRGAAEARLKDMKYKRDPPDEAFLAPWTVRIREALGEIAYATAFGSGLVLSHEQAVEEALAWVGKRLESVSEVPSVASMQGAHSSQG